MLRDEEGGVGVEHADGGDEAARDADRAGAALGAEAGEVGDEPGREGHCRVGFEARKGVVKGVEGFEVVVGEPDVAGGVGAEPVAGDGVDVGVKHVLVRNKRLVGELSGVSNGDLIIPGPIELARIGFGAVHLGRIVARLENFGVLDGIRSTFLSQFLFGFEFGRGLALEARDVFEPALNRLLFAKQAGAVGSDRIDSARLGRESR